MSAKVLTVVAVFCLVCFFTEAKASFIKPNNVPRVGRSNEADGFYDHTMGYVIKTIPSKNIPRMGRRNYDSENRFDIPKLYQLPAQGAYEDQREQAEALYETQMENMQK